MIDVDKTALILVGYQNEYFRQDGLLNEFVEETIRTNHVLENTIDLVQALPESVPIIATPIHFTKDYSELTNPIGILKVIQDLNAFQIQSPGSEMIDELKAFGNRIEVIEGKRGFNAFMSTHLDESLRIRDIEHVVITGAITSICIDSTGRHAHELGYKISILSNCTAAKSLFEQQFYCDSIFPNYATVLPHQDFLQKMWTDG